MLLIFSIFVLTIRVKNQNRTYRHVSIIMRVFILCFYSNSFWLQNLMMNLNIDTEKNSGPSSYLVHYLTICH